MVLDKDSSKPLYKQLVEEILKNIRDGKFTPNDKLPTERELSNRFNISRGTVKKAFKELADNGVIEIIQGSGTYVYDNGCTVNNERRKIAVNMIDELITKLDKWDFSIEEISNLMKISIAAKKEDAKGRIRVAVIDCNTESLEIFKRQLLYIADISVSVFLVESILLDDNPEELLFDYDLILTTMTHYEKIAGRIGILKDKLIRVAVTPSRDTIITISRLPAKMNIGIFCRTNKFSQIIFDQLQYFLPQLKAVSNHFESSLQDYDYNTSLLQQYDAIIIDPDSILFNKSHSGDVLEKYIANGGKVIPFDYIIDSGSLVHIEERIANLVKKENNAGA